MEKKELVFDLVTALKCGKCWTSQGYLVKLHGVLCSSDDDYPIKGCVYGRFLYSEELEWTLEGKLCLGCSSALDLITIKPC